MTLATLGDGAGWVAFAWTTLERGGDASDVGWLVVAYTAPVLVGGPLVGMLLDRFNRRTLLILDNIARAVLMALIPIAYAIGALELWHIYIAAAGYGLLKMFPLAGVPALIPDIVEEAEIDAANAMETVSFQLGSVVGPALGGVLLAFIAGPYVLALNAFTYALFAAALLLIGPIAGVASGSMRVAVRPALAFVVRTPVLLATTIMFMLVNIGEGLVIVLLPLYVVDVGGDAIAYGAMLGVSAAAALAGAAVAGATGGRIPYGRGIAGSEVLAGLLLLPFAASPALPLALIAVGGSWFFLGPLTVWAQTVRMRVIPAEMRGRVFGILRTAMQGTIPVGGILAAPVIALGGLDLAFAAAALVILVPGVVGLFIPAMQLDYRAGRRRDDQGSTAPDEPPPALDAAALAEPPGQVGVEPNL